MLMVGVLAILMVSTIRYPSFKSFGKTKWSARLGVLLVASTIMLLWLYSRQMLLIMWSAYILNSLIRAAASMLHGLRRLSSVPSTNR
jgi:phosphatidylserine synthase